jgi:hypothetical protein
LKASKEFPYVVGGVLASDATNVHHDRHDTIEVVAVGIEEVGDHIGPRPIDCKQLS